MVRVVLNVNDEKADVGEGVKMGGSRGFQWKMGDQNSEKQLNAVAILCYDEIKNPIPSMHGLFTYIWMIFMVNM